METPESRLLTENSGPQTQDRSFETLKASKGPPPRQSLLIRRPVLVAKSLAKVLHMALLWPKREHNEK